MTCKKIIDPAFYLENRRRGFFMTTSVIVAMSEDAGPSSVSGLAGS
jgi:hypothetical protein